MLIQDVKTTTPLKQAVLGFVWAFGLAGPAFAGDVAIVRWTPKKCNCIHKQRVSTFVQVCKIDAITAPLTPNLSVTSTAGNVAAHGRETEAQIPVYARIVAQDATATDATNLANGVVISTENETVSAQNTTVNYPRSLEVDFEVFTPSATDLSLSSVAGNVFADSYTATLNATAAAGDIFLHTIDGNVSAKTDAGNITIDLNGSGWAGAGLTATTAAGNVLVSRPVGYQALITATTNLGEVKVDGTAHDLLGL